MKYRWNSYLISDRTFQRSYLVRRFKRAPDCGTREIILKLIGVYPNDTGDLCSCNIHKQTTSRSLIKLSLNLHAICCQVPHTFPSTLPTVVLSSYLQLVLNLFPSLEECETNNWFIEMHNSTAFFEFAFPFPFIQQI